MSCRTTHLGSIATTFASILHSLEDSQSTALFHEGKRNYDEANIVTDSQLLSTIDAYENSIRQLPEFREARQGVQERALHKIAQLRSSTESYDNATKHAFVSMLRDAHAARLVMDAWTEAQHSLSLFSNNEVSPREEFKRLVKEYKKAKAENPTATAQSLSESVPSGFPKDKATKYAVAMFIRGTRCADCGQYIGLPNHNCPTVSTPNTSQIDALVSSEVPETIPMPSAVRPAIWLSENVEYDLRGEDVIVPIEDFQAIYDDLRREISEGAPYLQELPYDAPGAVTGRLAAPLGGRSMGLELEFDFPEEDYPYFDGKHDLARRLYSEGLSVSPYVERWHYVGDDRPGGNFQVTPGGWICEFDRSVDPYEGERGIEIKSQILYDEPATWRNLKLICEHANNLGAAATTRTGLHVNIGAHDFSSSDPSMHNNLLRIAGAYDDVLLRLAHNPQLGSWHRGRAYCGYAEVPMEGFSSVAQARARSNHYQAFNLGHLPAEGDFQNQSSRIEVRIWDGTTSFERIQTATAVSLAFVELSKNKINLGHEVESAGFHRNNFGTTKLEGEAWTEATKSFRTFLGLYKSVGLNTDNHIRNLIALFAESRWQRATY